MKIPDVGNTLIAFLQGKYVLEWIHKVNRNSRIHFSVQLAFAVVPSMNPFI